MLWNTGTFDRSKFFWGGWVNFFESPLLGISGHYRRHLHTKLQESRNHSNPGIAYQCTEFLRNDGKTRGFLIDRIFFKGVRSVFFNSRLHAWHSLHYLRSFYTKIQESRNHLNPRISDHCAGLVRNDAKIQEFSMDRNFFKGVGSIFF